jgi:DNA polymerase sigma
VRFKNLNQQNRGELLLGYFFYYGFAFDYQKHKISLNSGTAVERKNGKVQKGHYWFHVEDPVETLENPARSLSADNFKQTRNEFMRAFLELSNGMKLKEVCQGYVTQENAEEKPGFVPSFLRQPILVSSKKWFQFPVRTVLKHLRH